MAKPAEVVKPSGEPAKPTPSTKVVEPANATKRLGPFDLTSTGEIDMLDGFEAAKFDQDKKPWKIKVGKLRFELYENDGKLEQLNLVTPGAATAAGIEVGAKAGEVGRAVPAAMCDINKYEAACTTPADPAITYSFRNDGTLAPEEKPVSVTTLPPGLALTALLWRPAQPISMQLPP